MLFSNRAIIKNEKVENIALKIAKMNKKSSKKYI